jgi:hypothetical protein
MLNAEVFGAFSLFFCTNQNIFLIKFLFDPQLINYMVNSGRQSVGYSKFIVS